MSYHEELFNIISKFLNIAKLAVTMTYKSLVIERQKVRISQEDIYDSLDSMIATVPDNA